MRSCWSWKLLYRPARISGTRLNFLPFFGSKAENFHKGFSTSRSEIRTPHFELHFLIKDRRGGVLISHLKNFEKLKNTVVVKLWRRSKYTISRTLLRLLIHEKHFFMKFFDSRKNWFFEKSWFTNFVQKSKGGSYLGGLLFRSLRNQSFQLWL